MTDAYLCDFIRTPIGRFGGALSSVRADDLGAIPLRALMARNAGVDWGAVDDVIFGCANQAGEDNRNVARMASLLAGLPVEVGGTTINRLCGSGADAVATGARQIRTGQIDVNGGAFNPNAPFGGYKQSGNGREFGRFGLEEFLEYKSMQLKAA